MKLVRHDLETIGKILFLIGAVLFVIGSFFLLFTFVALYPFIGLITLIVVGGFSLLGSYLIDRKLYQ